MALVLLAIGAVLVVTAVRGTQAALFSLLGQDVPAFVIWAAAIIAIGVVGFIPGLKPVSRGILALVILAVILTQYRNILAGFAAADTATAGAATTGAAAGSGQVASGASPSSSSSSIFALPGTPAPGTAASGTPLTGPQITQALQGQDLLSLGLSALGIGPGTLPDPLGYGFAAGASGQ